MLLTPVFQHIKDKLQPISAIQVITFYNGQTDNIIHNVPAVLINFPNAIQAQTLGGGAQQGELTIRVQLISKLHTLANGEIDTTTMATHENIVLDIYNALEHTGFKLQPNGVIGINSLMRMQISLDMSNPGFAITAQDFGCEIYQKAIKNITEILPDANINVSY